VTRWKHTESFYRPLRATVEALEIPPARNNQEAKTHDWPGRIPPVTDTKMIVAWNSLMISGLARAYGVFRQPEYLELAARAANFILDNQWSEKGRLNLPFKSSGRWSFPPTQL